MRRELQNFRDYSHDAISRTPVRLLRRNHGYQSARRQISLSLVFRRMPLCNWSLDYDKMTAKWAGVG